MTDFSNWTLDAQKALWRRIADDVIPRWNLGPATIGWLGYSTNAVFKVSTADGEYVLRLGRADKIDDARLRSELQWLRAIRRNTDLLAPYPVSTSEHGRDTLFLTASNALLPPPQLVQCSLFEYIGGEVKSASHVNAGDSHQIGRYLGRLHSHGQFEPPAGFDRPRLDWAGLFGTDSPYHSDMESDFLRTTERDIMEAVAQRVQDVMSHLDGTANSVGLLHADLLAKNIVFCDHGLGALDFEYCGWGYYLYDLAPLLWQLKGERSADYRELEDALWAGYTSVRALHAGSRDLLETMIAARQLASCRWLIQNLHHPNVRQFAPTLLAGRVAELREFLTSGRLCRATLTL